MKILQHINTVVFLTIVGCSAIVAQNEEEDKSTLPPLDPENINILEIGILNGDTLPIISLDEVPIIASRFMTPEEELAYRKLKRNVIKVYPYAQRALSIINEVNVNTESLEKRRQKKKYRKRMEKYLQTEFKDELKKLTVSQGKVLVKLIERETGEPFYKLVKENKNGFTAFFYHNIGKSFGYDLKQGFHPDKYLEHQDIDQIVTYLEKNGVEYFGYRAFPKNKKLESFDGLPSSQEVLERKRK